MTKREVLELLKLLVRDGLKTIPTHVAYVGEDAPCGIDRSALLRIIDNELLWCPVEHTPSHGKPK